MRVDINDIEIVVLEKMRERYFDESFKIPYHQFLQKFSKINQNLFVWLQIEDQINIAYATVDEFRI